jgi:hypothetical protein
MFGSTIVFGLATIAFAQSTSIWLAAAAMVVAGGVDMISVYVRSSLIQLATPDSMRGRVSAVSFVFISASNELGDFEAGLMARIFGPVMAVTSAAARSRVTWMDEAFPVLAQADGFEPIIRQRLRAQYVEPRSGEMMGVLGGSRRRYRRGKTR